MTSEGHDFVATPHADRRCQYTWLWVDICMSEQYRL